MQINLKRGKEVVKNHSELIQACKQISKATTRFENKLINYKFICILYNNTRIMVLNYLLRLLSFELTHSQEQHFLHSSILNHMHVIQKISLPHIHPCIHQCVLVYNIQQTGMNKDVIWYMG